METKFKYWGIDVDKCFPWGVIALQSPDGKYEAWSKSSNDGCVNINESFVGPPDTPDHVKELDESSIHICDLSEYIARLIELKEICEAFMEKCPYEIPWLSEKTKKWDEEGDENGPKQTS